ncbi:MAG: hypothetical protein ISQ13_03150 [Candidatus Margulisbacteria bacterium]|jgi:hypothetical protein|nr:hypothetical protein [Candidatus Margulisiibacteriota bacterium]
MTVNEFLNVMVPALTVVLIGVFIYFGIQLVVIATRIKKIIERVDTLSDVAGWVSMLRQWPRRNKSSS